MKRRSLRLMGIGAVAGLYLLQARPAGAVHLFPLFPGDPTGDCAAVLADPPSEPSAATVLVEGFFFLDPVDGDATVTVPVGTSVTWRWVKFCHSVTSTSGPVAFGTFGGASTGPVAGQPQLVKPEGTRTNFTVTFTQDGTYQYECVHHTLVGMKGTVIVV